MDNKTRQMDTNCTDESVFYDLPIGDGNGSVSTDGAQEYGLRYKLPLDIVGFFGVVMTTIAMVALSHTKKTPKNVRILSTCLLFFDSLGTVLFTIRRHSSSNAVSTIVQLCGVYSILTAFLIVAAMSLDRLLVFQYPNFYIKHVTFKRSKYFAIVLVLITMAVYSFIRVGICALKVGNMTYDDIMITCQPISFSFFRIFIGSVVIISVICYIKIIQIIRGQFTKKRFNNFEQPIKMYKSTGLVGVFLANVMFTGMCYAISVLIDEDLNLIQLMVDFVNILNNIMDTLIYVLWFKECRMQLLRMLSLGFPSLSTYIEKMKIDIFLVVTSTTSVSARRTNIVTPVNEV